MKIPPPVTVLDSLSKTSILLNSIWLDLVIDREPPYNTAELFCKYTSCISIFFENTISIPPPVEFALELIIVIFLKDNPLESSDKMPPPLYFVEQLSILEFFRTAFVYRRNHMPPPLLEVLFFRDMFSRSMLLPTSSLRPPPWPRP